MPHLIEWLKVHQPQVMALQEIKMIESQFPYQEFSNIGYHSVCLGQPAYNGVAFLSKNEPEEVLLELPNLSTEPLQRRAMAMTYRNIRMINLYVPNGESLISPKFSYKLAWLSHFKNFISEEKKRYNKIIFMGDFNVAPQDQDVHNPKAWYGHVIVSEKERSALKSILAEGFIDIYRTLYPEGKDFSWWDYRSGAFFKNQGLRIDHIMVSENLREASLKCFIDKTPRGWTRPSDHAPIVLELEDSII